MVLAMESRPSRWSTGFGEGVPHIMSLAHERERTGEGLVAELMQCHPASELAGNCLQLAALVAVPQNEEERRTQQHPS